MSLTFNITPNHTTHFSVIIISQQDTEQVREGTNLPLPRILPIPAYADHRNKFHCQSNGIDIPLPILPVGQWEPKSSPSFSISIVPAPQRNGESNDTHLQTEQGESSSNSPRAVEIILQREPTHTRRGSLTSEQMLLNPLIDCYQLEWFWILILTILLSTFTVVLLVLVVTGRVTKLYTVILDAIACIPIANFSYTVVFVTLSTFHK